MKKLTKQRKKVNNMKTFLIKFNKCGYDMYDGFVVVAEDEQAVIELLKDKYPILIEWSGGYEINEVDNTKMGIILKSFRAG